MASLSSTAFLRSLFGVFLNLMFQMFRAASVLSRSSRQVLTVRGEKRFCLD
jgi:hypothetical protein